MGCRPDGLCDECGFEAFWEVVNELPDTNDDSETTTCRLSLARDQAYIMETRTALRFLSGERAAPAVLEMFDRHGASPQGEGAAPPEGGNGGGGGNPLDVPGGDDSDADDSQKDNGPAEDTGNPHDPSSKAYLATSGDDSAGDEERRLGIDGAAYTWTAFIDFYGAAQGKAEWHTAAPDARSAADGIGPKQAIGASTRQEPPGPRPQPKRGATGPRPDPWR